MPARGFKHLMKNENLIIEANKGGRGNLSHILGLAGPVPPAFTAGSDPPGGCVEWVTRGRPTLGHRHRGRWARLGCDHDPPGQNASPTRASGGDPGSVLCLLALVRSAPGSPAVVAIRTAGSSSSGMPTRRQEPVSSLITDPANRSRGGGASA